MKKTLTLLLILISASSGFSQSKEISKILSDSLDNVAIEVRLNRLATSSNYYKADDQIKISATFEINSKGELINVGVRAPLPEIEGFIRNKLKNIIIPKDILDKTNGDYIDVKIALPIIFQVKSESDIIKLLEKDKRKKEREKRKKSKKN